ncbi:DNA polymerase V subunit UmuC (plasmid) [Vibrio nigripulchritudo]|uniref:Y-family DNA polymerase n=1 Tax=Vibrio nigripulchritudo TaxID=28173 RepID=UPI00190B51B0|nr:Y-family DNA polymerase [Vibrio nigripulchritudo]BCL74038.1 DNA polymerase V subunit UmuC [Vibrio nigripulchritudo]BDU35415.1 DNA polymerase V subunit UmuC [Vibrio nigripulchritudo]
MPNYYALVDANSYYASSEAVFQLELRRKGVIVLSNGDGVVVAANKIALAAGIKKFAPFHEVRELCDLHDIAYFSSNYELYADLSTRLMTVIGRFAPTQHVYSIDECFLSFKGCNVPDIKSHAREIRKCVWRELRLPVCVGVGTTLTLSKLANHASKKVSGYEGVCILDSQAEVQRLLKQVHVSDIWGIGSRLATRMKWMGISTGYDFYIQRPAEMRKDFSIEVERVLLELRGIPSKTWDAVRADKQQIFSSRSFRNRIKDRISLEQAIATHANIAATKAREQQSQCGTMICFASNSAYDESPKNFKAIHRFAEPTSDSRVITKAAINLAEQLFVPGVDFYKIGIGLVDLTSAKNRQLSLFSPVDDPACMETFDHLNRKYGRDTVFLAAQGINNKWAMARKYLSKQFTTNWRHLPRVKC